MAITSSSTSPGRGRTTVGSAQATSLTATDSVISSGSALSIATSLDDLSEAASSTSDTTTRSAFTRTTTSLAAAASDVDRVSSATSASRPVNPKIGNNGLATNGTDSDINSDSSNQDINNNDVNGGKKGLSTGAVVGVAIGLILAFALVGLLVWYIRKYIIARQKDKELLRSSDNAGGGNGDDDWINDNIGSGGEKNENDRIERTMSERMGGDSSMNLAGVIQPGIGAYARNTLQSHHSEGSIAGIGAPNQHYSIMSQKQYEDINAALAYPSHMGISPVPAPYNTHHSQDQLQGYPQQHPQGGYIHPFAQQQMQQQQQQQYHSQVSPHARDSLPALPPVAFYQTPRNSLNSIQAPNSIGGDSGRAAHLSHSGTMDSPYPESITMTPDTTSNNVMGGPAGMNHAGVPNASINPSDLTASQLGKYQSIPFIIPAQTQHQSIIAVGGASESGAGSNRDSQQTARQSRRMSSLPVARSLTAGQGDLSSSTQSTVAGQVSARDSKQLQMAQGIPLPMSPPQRQTSLPMPLPGLDNEQASAIPGVAQQPTLPTENITREQEIVKKAEEDQQHNPFEDGAKEEKSRTSFEGLAYLAR